jgi:hypothetical protein
MRTNRISSQQKSSTSENGKPLQSCGERTTNDESLLNYEDGKEFEKTATVQGVA